MTFSEMSKSLRQEKKITQIQLAEALQVSKACISMIEIGKNEPTANTLIKYADYFNVSTDYLLGRSDDFGNITVRAEKVGEFLSPDEKEILNTYRKLPYTWKMRVRAYIDVSLEMSKEEQQRKNG
ncbi:MAG: helix-turn-helix domain-containing protein [Candidatus Scatosoma sp.]